MFVFFFIIFIRKNMDHDEISISLSRIDEVSDKCTYNRHIIKHYKGERITVNLNTSLTPNHDNGTITLVLQTTYKRPSLLQNHTMLEYTAAATFDIDHPERVLVADNDGASIHIPHHILTMMLGIAIGAMRGMMAVRLADTPLASYPLPVINVAELARRISMSPAVA